MFAQDERAYNSEVVAACEMPHQLTMQQTGALMLCGHDIQAQTDAAQQTPIRLVDMVKAQKRWWDRTVHGP
jgi:hypothetical protein